MKVDKVIERLKPDPHNMDALRSAGESLGDEIPKGQLKVLNAFLVQMVRITEHIPFNTWTRGYLDALMDVAAAASAVLRNEEIRPSECPAVTAALRSHLEYGDPDEVIFREGIAGRPITAAEALKMLEEGSPLIREFIQDVHGAALRTVLVRRKKEEAGG